MSDVIVVACGIPKNYTPYVARSYLELECQAFLPQSFNIICVCTGILSFVHMLFLENATAWSSHE